MLDKTACWVFYAAPAGESVAGGKDLEELLVGESLGGAVGAGANLAGEHGGELGVEFDEFAGDFLALGFVGVQKIGSFCSGEAVEVVHKLPCEVVRVHHRDVHSLARFRRVGMAGCTRVNETLESCKEQ